MVTRKSIAAAILAATTLLGASTVWAQGYVERDPWSKGRYNSYDSNGNSTGYVERDPWSKDRYNTYDSNGNSRGYIERDPWSKDRWNTYRN